MIFVGFTASQEESIRTWSWIVLPKQEQDPEQESNFSEQESNEVKKIRLWSCMLWYAVLKWWPRANTSQIYFIFILTKILFYL